MRVFGYTAGSLDQVAWQMNRLKELGAEHIYSDDPDASTSIHQRPGLKALLKHLCDDDVLLVLDWSFLCMTPSEERQVTDHVDELGVIVVIGPDDLAQFSKTKIRDAA